MNRPEIIVRNEKKKTTMPQIKPSSAADFLYETKVGFLFIVVKATPLATLTEFSGDHYH